MSATVHDTLLLTPEEAAEELRVSRRTIFDLLKSGALESVLLGYRSRRIPRAALLAYIESLREWS